MCFIIMFDMPAAGSTQHIGCELDGDYLWRHIMRGYPRNIVHFDRSRVHQSSRRIDH